MSLNKNNRGAQSQTGAKQKRARIITLAVLGAMLVCCLAFCTACFSREQLPAPENLKIDHDTMRFTWDEVEYSTGGYIIEIDEVEYPAHLTTFEAHVLKLAPGDHHARVKALTEDTNYYRDSEWSEMYHFTITAVQAGLSYRLINNGAEYEVANSGSMEFDDAFTIPDTFNGKPITRIGVNAFYGSSAFNIVLGNNITEIADSAFYNCNKLEFITLGKNITSIGNYAFFNCSLLSTIELPSSLVSIGQSAFSRCQKFTEIVIPNSVTSLGISAFETCSALKKITIGSGLTTIPRSAFFNCAALTDVILGGYEPVSGGGQPTFVSRLEYITRSSFKECRSLMTMSIPNSVMIIENDTFTKAGFYTAALENDDMLIYLDKWLIDFNEDFLPKSIDDDTEHDVVIADDTIAIANAALSGFINMATVDIPESIVKMGTGVFYGCLLLKEVDFKASMTEIPFRTFASCVSLETVTLHDKLERIGQEAFYECRSLFEDGIDIPESVTSIGQNAFRATGTYADTSAKFKAEGSKTDGIVYFGNWLVTYIPSTEDIDPRTSITVRAGTIGMADYALSWLQSITMVTFDAPLQHMGIGAFSNCTGLTSLPDISGLTEIRAYTFNGCNSKSTIDNLWQITLHDNITSIGEGAFRRAGVGRIVLSSQITEIPTLAFSGSALIIFDIPETITSIGDRAFMNCAYLSEITIPESVESIGASAFQNCTLLGSIALPSKITEISDGMFRGCTMLTTVSMPNIKRVGNHAFRGCEALTSITLPSSVTSIGSHAFRDCTRLASFVIPDSVTSIGTYVFAGCVEMRNMVFGSGINTVSVGMFFSCMLLSNVVFPPNIKSIGDYAFSGCTSLRAINIGDNIIGMGKHVFIDISNLTVYTEATSSEKWDAEWNSTMRPVLWNCKFDATKSYVVSFIKNSEASIFNPSDFAIQSPIRSGYTFYGWGVSPDGVGQIYSSIKDVKYGVEIFTLWKKVN